MVPCYGLFPVTNGGRLFLVVRFLDCGLDSHGRPRTLRAEAGIFDAGEGAPSAELLASLLADSSWPGGETPASEHPEVSLSTGSAPASEVEAEVHAWLADDSGEPVVVGDPRTYSYARQVRAVTVGSARRGPEVVPRATVMGRSAGADKVVPAVVEVSNPPGKAYWVLVAVLLAALAGTTIIAVSSRGSLGTLRHELRTEKESSRALRRMYERCRLRMKRLKRRTGRRSSAVGPVPGMERRKSRVQAGHSVPGGSEILEIQA